MHHAYHQVQLAQNPPLRQRMRRTALSLFIGGLFCSAAPVWADCVSDGINVNGGLSITCEGAGSTFDYTITNSSLSNNIITVKENDTVVDNQIWGGYSRTAAVTDNSVTLNNNSRGNSFVMGGFGNGPGSIAGNSVTLNDSSSVSSAYGGSVLNSSGSGTVSGNSVTLNGSSVSDDNATGGSVNAKDSATATGNSVTLNDSSSTQFAYGAVVGRNSFPLDVLVSDNSVTLNNNSSVRDAIGGDGNNGLNNGTTGTVTLTNNTVTLNHNSSAEVIIGGSGTSGGIVIVTNNTVNINDNATVSDRLIGGYTSYSDDGQDKTNGHDTFTGNTLNFAAAPITLSGKMANFEHYNFTVDPSLVNTDTALITAETITFGTNDTNMKGGDANTSKIQVVGIKAGNELFADDKFVLMQATGTMSGEAEGKTTEGIAQQGISLLYDVRTDVDTEGKLVTATILGKEKPIDPVEPPIDPEKPVVPPVEPGKPAARVNPQLKALSEGHLASAMMITRGADTLAYNTVHTIQHQNPQKGLAPFITLSGGKTRYNSGSHINAKDGLLTGGLSYQTEKLTSAVLIESGWGSYDTHNGFDTMNNVNGDGHSRYVGGAVLGHYDFDSGVFAEASLRAGKNRNTFDTKDIVNLSTGERAHYNLDSNYLGAHIGTGYRKDLDEKNTADVSAKYLWTQLKGKDVKVAGDNIHFDDINSHRVRLDAGLSHQYTEAVAVRAGLGYEYEFDGKANATTYSYGIGAPSVQGSTAILTLGSTVKPLATQPLNIDLNLNGYTGQRDGVGGSVKFSYAF